MEAGAFNILSPLQLAKEEEPQGYRPQGGSRWPLMSAHPRRSTAPRPQCLRCVVVGTVLLATVNCNSLSTAVDAASLQMAISVDEVGGTESNFARGPSRRELVSVWIPAPIARSTQLSR